MIVAYVSGHGLGHATRTGEVLRAVRAAAPDQPLAVVSAAPEWLFRRAVPGAFAFHPRELDVGVVQSDALTTDEGATAERWREFAADHAGRARLIYTERGEFPEYAVLVAEMPRYLPVAFVSNEDLRRGRLGAALEEVLSGPFPPEPDLGGAEAAARRLLAYV